MKQKEYLSFFCSSPLGLATIGLSVASGIITTIITNPLSGSLFFSGIFIILNTILAKTGLAARAVKNEQEKKLWKKSKVFVENAKTFRTRLASTRISDVDVKKMIDLVAMRASSYISACETAKSHDPKAMDALESCVSIIDSFKKELDSSSTEKRYGLEDSDPFVDAKQRTIALLKNNAAIIEKSTLDLNGNILPSEKIEIEESL